MQTPPQAHFGDVPLYITENGTSDRLGNTDDLAR